MNRRTSRRRISPRTVRRYRAIKNFVRRALGSSSQADIKTNSSISVSVLDLRQKINGIEQQLNTVSKHCEDLATLESKFKLKNNLDLEKYTDLETKKINEIKTEVLHETSQNQLDKTINNRQPPKIDMRDDIAGKNVTASNKIMDQKYSYNKSRKSKFPHRLDPIEHNEQRLRKHRKQMTSNLYEELPMYTSHSFNERSIYVPHPDVSHSEVRRRRNFRKMEYFDTNDGLIKLNNHKERGDHRNQSNKHVSPDLDQDFIADIIRRQYRPVKLFGRRESDFSQFSAPICRDQEFSIRETIQEGTDLCSCCHEEHKRHRHTKYMCSNDLSDMRSICDTHLYSSKNPRHVTGHKKHSNDFYNDSTMYDVIPVKEKSSPKSRKKFVEENLFINDNYREVPPSPRTRKPRLNLRAQLQVENDGDDEIALEKQLKYMKRLRQRTFIQNEENISNMSSEVFTHNRNFKCTQNSQFSNTSKPYLEECVGTSSNLQYPILIHKQGVINKDTTLNTQITDLTAEKTDKTLSEIKDILQSFLQEIKKESSQSEKLISTPQSELLANTNESQQTKNNSFNNNNDFTPCGLPSFMQSFPNSCCYPMLPVCPINCMQNGFVVPSPSFTCATCANNSKERTCGKNDFKNKTNILEDESSETQKLIKEIHNLILQNSNSTRKKLTTTNIIEETKNLKSKSACGSYKTSKQDAKVGTRKLKCHSKSCEAIGSRETADARYDTTVSYSDTVLEKGSGEEVTTESASESEYSSNPTIVDKKKGSKFRKILRSIGILKRNKSDVIVELTESNSSVDDTKPKPKPGLPSYPTSPYQQHIINYNMHGQEYFHSPVTPHNQHQYEYCNHDPRTYYSPTIMDKKNKNTQRRHYKEHDVMAHCASPNQGPMPFCANLYNPHYANVPPQVPVCLKEIEVKSIGTQSVRKLTLLQKLTNKMQVPVQQEESTTKQSSTRTTSKGKNTKDKTEPSLFNWKKVHEEAMQKTTDPLKFSFKTQNKLAASDNKMRNAMLKKLFYKRNPFSPRNLLVSTLLGKDRSSFGEPPKMYKPRMFL